VGSGAACPPSWILGKKQELKKRKYIKISIIRIKSIFKNIFLS
jgi:hypothetical protein